MAPAPNPEVGDAAARRAHQNKMRWARFAPSLTRRRQSFAHPTVQHDGDAARFAPRIPATDRSPPPLHAQALGEIAAVHVLAEVIELAFEIDEHLAADVAP